MKIEIICNIIKSIFVSLYEYFWPSLLLGILILMVLNCLKLQSLESMITDIYCRFREDKLYRNKVVYVFFISFFIMRLLIGRGLNLKPLDDIFGGWALRNEDGRVNSQFFENIIVFTAYIYLMFLNFGQNILKKEKSIYIIREALRISFESSFIIEAVQVVFVLGSFQIVDLLANTIGGLLGGMLYWLYKLIISWRDGR